MKLFLLWLGVVGIAMELPAAERENFDQAKPGALPAGWTSAQTGGGKPVWAVVADASAPSGPHVLRQSGTADYPLALKDGIAPRDGFVEVKFKPVKGEDDQAGGVVWRVKDARNYYIARANALEGNVRIYHFLDGKRTQFKGINLPVAAGQWHTLRVEFTGSRFKVVFNGRLLFEAEDATHAEAGRVGLWTKADSETLFDDFSYGPN